MNLSLKASEVPPHLRKYFTKQPPRYKAGDLVDIPHLVANALQASGWILRQDIIWSKPSPMPESVTNRCTKSHEYIFLLVKRQGYYYDAEAIKERQAEASLGRQQRGTSAEHKNIDGAPGQPAHAGAVHKPREHDATREVSTLSNKRSVWNISSQGYEGAHFATYPPKLIEPCILAGCPAVCCATCGTGWRRITSKEKLTRERPNDYVKRTGAAGTGNSCANSVAGVAVQTLGWEPDCACHGKQTSRKRVVENEDGTRKVVRLHEYKSKLPLGDHPTTPGTVLDPFIGSGTTCCVAIAHDRRSIGIDLSEEYLRNQAVPRIEGVLLSIPAKAELTHYRPTALSGKTLKKGK